MIQDSKRTINIYLQSSKGTEDWKSFLSKILSKTTPYNTYKYVTDSNLLSVVDPKVTLPMTSVPSTDARYETKEPLANIVENTKSGISSVVGQVANVLFPGSKEIAESLTSTAINIGEAVYTGTSGNIFNPWWTSVPALDSGAVKRPTFSLSFDFAMGQFGLWNATEEVVKPILNLCAPVLLKELTDFTYKPPFPSAAMLTKKALNTILDYSQDENHDGIIDALTGIYDSYTYTVEFGDFITYSRMLLKAASSSFSNKVDDQGMPISGSVTLEFQALVPYTAGARDSRLINVKYSGGK